ncbi:MAG TPA: nuclease A inhibitor family protein [Abditibacteriaceae bacterium]|jgi:hypothetical protein
MLISSDAVRQTLESACQGLLYPSDTDAPFEPFFWPEEDPGPLTPQELTRLAGVAAETPVKTVRVETLFRPVTKQEEWHNDAEKMQIKSFENLLATIKATLDDVKVYRVGKTTIDVYIVGSTEGGYAGLKTRVVES